MKPREIQATGKIDADGNLKMYMGELRQFFALHKNRKVVARFFVLPEELSEALKGYYFNYVVPAFKTAFWDAGERYNEEETEERLRQLSPIMYEKTPINGKYKTRLKNIDELDNAELCEHIETLKELGAEEFNIYIEEPNEYK